MPKFLTLHIKERTVERSYPYDNCIFIIYHNSIFYVYGSSIPDSKKKQVNYEVTYESIDDLANFIVFALDIANKSIDIELINIHIPEFMYNSLTYHIIIGLRQTPDVIAAYDKCMFYTKEKIREDISIIRNTANDYSNEYECSVVNTRFEG